MVEDTKPRRDIRTAKFVLKTLKIFIVHPSPVLTHSSEMRTSFQGLCRLIMSQTPERTMIEQTGWLRHIRLVLEAAIDTAKIVCIQNKRYLASYNMF